MGAVAEGCGWKAAPRWRQRRWNEGGRIQDGAAQKTRRRSRATRGEGALLDTKKSACMRRTGRARRNGAMRAVQKMPSLIGARPWRLLRGEGLRRMAI